MNIRNLTAMAAVAAALTIAAQARADVIDFYLTQQECTDSGACASAAVVPALGAASNTDAVEVQVATTGAQNAQGNYAGATVEFFGVGNFNNTSPTADINSPVYINLNNGGSTANVTATSTSPGGTNGIAYYNDSGQAEDHFGNMNLGTPGGFHYATVIFTLTAANGFGGWIDAADVLMLDAGFSSFYKSVNGDPGFEAVVAGSDGAPQYAGWYPGPAPIIGHGLFPLLAVGGVLSGSKLLENFKKRQFHRV